MKIAFVSSEVAPFSKTGGLADVAGTLPPAIAAAGGHEVVVVTPLYAPVDRKAHGLRLLAPRGEIPGLGGAEVWQGWIGQGPGRVRVLFIGAAAFDRPGLYQIGGRDFPDNDDRFSFFSRGVLALLKHINFAPDILHVNDWQTALIPVYLKTHYLADGFFSRTGTVLSIHNMAYQGVFEPHRWRALGLPNHLFRAEALEFYGKINFLKGGIVFSDLLSTVSPRYAQEIQSRSNGCGLDGVLASRKNTLFGVLNGINYAEWDPARADGIFPPYDAGRLDEKSAAKKILREQFGLAAPAASAPDGPILGCVMRLDPQKGCDILLRALFRILPHSNAQFVLVGTGARELESAFSNLARKFPGKAGLALKFDARLARLVYAGSDFFLMPSKYEPCGLGQMIAMAHGTVPIVRRTGGLADSVRPYNERTGEGTGLVFDSYTSDGLNNAIQSSLQLYRNPKVWQALRRNAMRERFTWEQAARTYLDLYGRAIQFRQKGGEDDMAVKTAEKQQEATPLSYEIGESAGKVYQYLTKKDEGDTPAQIAKSVGLESSMSAMAIGWLARENNVVVERAGKKIQVRLIRR